VERAASSLFVVCPCAVPPSNSFFQKRDTAFAAVNDSAWLGRDSIPAAPTFYPTPDEAVDPIAYIRKISPEASRFGAW
jgi:hypothetical protein